MNIDWKEIKEKYQKGYDKIVNWFCSSDDWDDEDEIFLNVHCCYCYVEKFFRENGIIIIIDFDVEEKKYWIQIIHRLFFVYFEPENLFEENEDAKNTAIIKAFEIMEAIK
jgi:hypothetical protein